MATSIPLATIKVAVATLQDSRAKMKEFLLASPGSALYSQVENLDTQASRAIAALNGQALKVIGADASDALKELKNISVEGELFIKNIKDIKNGLKVVASFLVLVGAVLMADPSGIVSAAKGVKQAIDNANADASP
ncbi:Uncharacterised protein [Delftia tsuruhatensis]|uniref:hypothetical protein n=1 Tax=Delftia tsuruhatensis TaxID=180282 RepID=UPI001E803A23|nr:hypothetical protein [Delftia tsuruhatensis]CAB5721098.1 Uncharacterised protein [Delftia tsuruhatensis]CAC9688060.1 Uncharacterised protein [Delftia tsuruhatensis]